MENYTKQRFRQDVRALFHVKLACEPTVNLLTIFARNPKENLCEHSFRIAKTNGKTTFTKTKGRQTSSKILSTILRNPPVQWSPRGSFRLMCLGMCFRCILTPKRYKNGSATFRNARTVAYSPKNCSQDPLVASQTDSLIDLALLDGRGKLFKPH